MNFENPDARVPGQDNLWAKLAVIILKCMNSDSLSRLIEKTNEYSRTEKKHREQQVLAENQRIEH